MSVIRIHQVKETDKYNVDYECNFCGYTFQRTAKKIARKVSTQIKCPYCGNFIKTWE